MKVRLLNYKQLVGILALMLGLGACGIPLTAFVGFRSLKEEARAKTHSMGAFGESLDEGRARLMGRCKQLEDSLQQHDSLQYHEFHTYMLEAAFLDVKLDSIIDHLESVANNGKGEELQDASLFFPIYKNLEVYENNVRASFCPHNTSDLLFPSNIWFVWEMLKTSTVNETLVLMKKAKTDLYRILVENQSCKE